ncbi:LysR family transcriptional regulator, partial [Neobacillus drentensis]|uniref:LysR family transcriptional regulator n=1 Tax=Neobacillus drentensis TaxID=220684 RepID=UPI003000388B
MEIKQMKYFCKVAEFKSFTKAAKELFVSQPAITNCIHQLENELNVKLFTRTTKKVSLTHEGKLFLNRVKPILSDISSSIDEIKSCNKCLTLELSYLMHNPIFLQSLLQFKKNYPDLCLKIKENGSILILS